MGYLDEDALEGGCQGDQSEFDEEIAGFEAGSARFDLALLLLVEIDHLEHQKVEEGIGHHGHGRFARRFQQREHRRRRFRIVQDVDTARDSCSSFSIKNML